MHLSKFLSTIILLWFLAGISGFASANEVQLIETSAAPTDASPAPIGTPFSGSTGPVLCTSSPLPAAPARPSPVKPTVDNSKKKKDSKKDSKKTNAKKDQTKDKDKDKKDTKDSETVSRPSEPPQAPDPKELEAGPGNDGLIQFNFKGQPWPAVLEWLAKISGKSLDWLEAPGGYVNLTTRRRYTPVETRDLINRLLLDRGFTVLCEGEIMTVVNLKKLNPSKVPRVLPDQLDKLQPYEFVKVSFPLTRLVAEKAVEELKPYSSPNGRLTAMPATNCIEAMDAVINLRDIRTLLTREQQATGRNRKPWVKRLQYRRASEVVTHLESLLGIASSGPAGSAASAQQKAIQAAMRKAAQQKGKKGGGPSMPKADDAIHLVADDHNNTIIAYAPPDKLAIIQEAIKAIDVQPQAEDSLQAMMGRIRRYHLSTMDPETLVKALQETGNLRFDTKMTPDSDSRTLIVSAGLVDHLKISKLIKQLDGTGRTSSVITLRRLPADYVAGTIRELLFGGTSDGNKKKRSFSLYSDWGYGSSRSKRKSSDRFRVDADVEANRLLIWANEFELAEVKNFLVSLGEDPDGAVNRETVRVLDVLDDKETQKLYEQLRQSWPSGGNPLLIEEGQSQQPSADQQTQSPPKHNKPGPRVTFAQMSNEKPSETPADNRPKLPPIAIRRNASGRLVISSEDTAALDRLEDLVNKLAPAPQRYKIFPLTNANCLDVVDNLKAYFKDETGPDLEEVYRAGWYGNSISVNDDQDSVGLSRRRPLRFIADIETNSILIKDATPGQLRLIEQLIKFYNAPKSVDSENARQQGLFRIQYSKAGDIAQTIKSLYRDLLSPNDKAFEGKNKGRSRGPTYVYRFSGDDEGTLERAPKFKGLLSMGVDDHSNTLLVSAPKYLYKHVAKMVVDLDNAAKPAVSTVNVVKIGQGINATELERALAEIVGSSSSSPKKSNSGKKNDSQAGQKKGVRGRNSSE